MNDNSEADGTLERPDTDAVQRLARAFFGRELSPDEVRVQIDSGRGYDLLRQSQITSLELQHKLARLTVPPAEFHGGAGPAQLALIGGRTALEVARQFVMLSGIPTIGISDHAALSAEHLRAVVRQGGDAILFEDAPGQMDAVGEMCRAHDLRVRRIQQIRFAGLHPDAVHLPAGEPTIIGLTGWHSALVAHAFTENLPPAACRQRFTHEVYGRCGYLDAFEREAERMTARDASMDITIAAAFIALARTMPCVSTPTDGNQPLHRLLAETIAAHCGLPTGDLCVTSTAMCRVAVWPVYPGLTTHLGFDHGGRMQFALETESFGLDHMIDRFYRSYSFWGPGYIREVFRPYFVARNLAD